MIARDYYDQIPWLPHHYLVDQWPRVPASELERKIALIVNMWISQAQISAEVNGR